MEIRRKFKRRMRDPRFRKKVKDSIFAAVSTIIILIIFIIVFRMLTS